MSKEAYKWTAVGLAVVIIGLVVYIIVVATLPRPVNTVALKQDLSDFSGQLQAWNVQYQQDPTAQGLQQLSSELSTFQQQLNADK